MWLPMNCCLIVLDSKMFSPDITLTCIYLKDVTCYTWKVSGKIFIIERDLTANSVSKKCLHTLSPFDVDMVKSSWCTSLKYASQIPDLIVFDPDSCIPNSLFVSSSGVGASWLTQVLLCMEQKMSSSLRCLIQGCIPLRCLKNTKENE